MESSPSWVPVMQCKMQQRCALSLKKWCSDPKCSLMYDAATYLMIVFSKYCPSSSEMITGPAPGREINPQTCNFKGGLGCGFLPVETNLIIVLQSCRRCVHTEHIVPHLLRLHPLRTCLSLASLLRSFSTGFLQVHCVPVRLSWTPKSASVFCCTAWPLVLSLVFVTSSAAVRISLLKSEKKMKENFMYRNTTENLPAVSEVAPKLQKFC